MIEANKLLIVAVYRNEQEFNQYVKVFSALNFHVSSILMGFKAEVRFVALNSTLSITCNVIRKTTDAKYIFWIINPVTMIHPKSISSLIEIFVRNPNFGILGLFGSEIPISGDYTKAKKIYGNYFWINEQGAIVYRSGNPPLYFQKVHALDSGFFATSSDLLFDENINDDFFIAAHCCSYRRLGYDVGVVYSEFPLVVFSNYNCIYEGRNNPEYAQHLEYFRTVYKDIVTPLVSICIPTYNQPHFCEIALQSSLNQTYPNIEVIVGDDSTNDDTKKMIQPYLNQFKNLKYFNHGGPLGDKGGKNTTFIINKSSGEYINVLFHDDVLATEKISRMMEYYVGDLENSISLITSARINIDENGKVTGKMNPWQPLKDEILSGEQIGRTIIFTQENYIGELSTVLLKREDLVTIDPLNGQEIVDIGIFCGVKDLAFGDIGTWLNVMKSGKNCIFIKDFLNARRHHSAQNGSDKFIILGLKVEWLNYLAIAYLNNVYIHSWDEYKLCFSKLKFTSPNSFGEYPDKDEKDAEKIITAIKFLKEAYSFIAEGKFEEVLDCSIRFLLDVLTGNNAIRPLVSKNSRTGLWEKADNGIMLHGNQRY